MVAAPPSTMRRVICPRRNVLLKRIASSYVSRALSTPLVRGSVISAAE
jgi:hypothetical protein